MNFEDRECKRFDSSTENFQWVCPIQGHWYAVSCRVGAADEILGAAQVIAATCVGAGDSRLAGRTFKLCALDEASQVDVMPQMLLCHGLVNLRCDNTDGLVA